MNLGNGYDLALLARDIGDGNENGTEGGRRGKGKGERLDGLVS